MTGNPSLLDAVRAAVSRYVVMPSEHAAAAVTLWIAATHAVQVCEHATRLIVRSPTKRCGKSRLLEIIGGLAHQPLPTTNISVPALFRIVEAAGDRPPTILLDEADRLLGTRKLDEDNANLVAMLNAGFRRGSPTWRCVGPKQIPMPFANFAFAAIASIDSLPDTIEDRGVLINMRRRMPGEPVHKFRLRDDLARLGELRDDLAGWTEDSIDKIDAAASGGITIPAELEDRQQDAWEPLLAIASVAGGEWPELAATAAVKLSREARADDAENLDARLLADLRTVFETQPPDTPFVPTATILTALRQFDDAPWADADFSARRLAPRLRKFGISPTRTRSERGYRISDFADAFARYLPGDTSQASQATLTGTEQSEPCDASKACDGSSVTPKTSVTGATAGQHANMTDVTDVTPTPPESDTLTLEYTE